jgi:hypothetical protein
VLKKNISDGVESQNVSNGTPLNPRLFWLDNIFKPIQANRDLHLILDIFDTLTLFLTTVILYWKKKLNLDCTKVAGYHLKILQQVLPFA